MTTLDHMLPLTGAARKARARGVLAVLREKTLGNAYLRLFAALIVIAAGAALLTAGIGGLLDLVVPLVFADELRALAALF